MDTGGGVQRNRGTELRQNGRHLCEDFQEAIVGQHVAVSLPATHKALSSHRTGGMVDRGMSGEPCVPHPVCNSGQASVGIGIGY